MTSLSDWVSSVYRLSGDKEVLVAQTTGHPQAHKVVNRILRFLVY